MTILFLLLFAGAALPFAFAPFGVYTFAFISPAVLFYTWLNAKPSQAFSRGLFFGLGFFSIGTSWIYISIHNYGNAPTPLAILITLLFILMMALYPATQGLIISRLFKNTSNLIKCVFVFPASWVVWEFLRGWLFGGFPWLFLGYSQTDTLLRGYAPIVGVYGLSLVITLISGSLIAIATEKNQKVKFACALLIVVLIFSGWELSKHQWTKPAGKPIKVSLIQGNIAQKLKWQSDQLQNILNVYKSLTEKNWDSKIIIWPEAAVPTFPLEVQPFIKKMNQEAKKNNTYLIFGAPIFNRNTQQYYNGMMMIGAGNSLYVKRHLVPFGEYIPLKDIFEKPMKYFKIPMSNFTPGAKIQFPFKINSFQIAPFICYEIAFPEEALQFIKGKQLIVTISDDSWFGRSIALAQHLQIARMRSLETGRYLLLSTNTGITAFINPIGKVMRSAKIDKQSVVTDTVVPMQGDTPLMRWDFIPIMVLIILMLLMGLITRRNNKIRKH